MVTTDCFLCQQRCGMETLILSVLKQPIEKLKEETSQLDAFFHLLESGSSSVGMNVEQETFSLKQLMTELRAADTALNIKKDLF